MKKIIIYLILIMGFSASSLWANISSVTVTPADPTTLSNGYSYYLAGRTYTFRVQASDPLATGQAYWGSGTVVMTVGGETVTITIATGAYSISGSSSTVVVTDNTSGYANLDYNIAITYYWDADEYTAASRNVTATVTESTNGSTGTDTKTFIFGVCSSMAVVSFVQTGVAADGYINPWHDSFNVTGVIVYNVPGAGASDSVYSVGGAGVITGTTLYYSYPLATSAVTSAGETDNNMLDGCSYTIDALYFSASALGDHYWKTVASVALPGTGGDETSDNNLLLNLNRVEITEIDFISGSGGGTNPPTPTTSYYRSVDTPGTQVQITARLQDIANSASLGGDRTMRGNTSITLSDGTNTTTVVVLSGASTSAATNVTYPTVASGSTTLFTYTATSVANGSLGGDAAGQNASGRIQQTSTYTAAIYWDNDDPPGTNGTPGSGQTPFTSFTGTDPSPITATSFTLNWTALTLASPNGDFYTYRIYYKQSTSTTWKIIDRNDSTTTGAANLGIVTTATFTVSGLQPLTLYDYYITAVDVFGNETDHPISSTSPPTAASPSISTSDACFANAPNTYGFDTLQTNPTSIEASVTDGITHYSFGDFETSGAITASNRPLRKTAIKITIYIVSSGDQPDNVNILLAQDDGSGTGILAPNDIISSTYESIACTKSAPNTWQAFIPSNNQFLVEGQYCRFIIESIRESISTYSDTNSVTDGDPDNYEYTFLVQTPTAFKPWPTKILNNVITSKDPVCYPAYYLSADAYVTITAHDIKGRTVATLIDRGFRKGGQNIKDEGWRGDNKARKKLGVGLYYIHFEAKRASDGKVILRDTKKVVIAK